MSNGYLNAITVHEKLLQGQCTYLCIPYFHFAYSAAIATLLNKQNPLAAFLWLWWPGGLKQSFISLLATKAILVRSEDLLLFFTLLMPFHCTLFLTSQSPLVAKLLPLLVWHSGKCSEKENLIVSINNSSACFRLITNDMLCTPTGNRHVYPIEVACG